MTTLYKYRIYCITDSKYEYIWAETEPTTCPTNTAHTIDSNSITIVETREPEEIKIKEEITPTGAHFAATTIKINAIQNTITSSTISFPFPISALSIEFVTTTDHYEDIINMVTGKDTIIGNIVANVSPATAWTSQNYTEGQTVTYNSKVYTCILNTVSNEVPTDTTYWQHGLRVPVSQSVIDNTSIGYFIKLDDLTNNDDTERIIKIDTTNNYIYVEINPTNSYLAATPTYIRQSVYTIRNYDIGPAWEHEIGASKIGGSYIPANVLVTIEYDNKSVTTDKVLIGRVEYLY